MPTTNCKFGEDLKVLESAAAAQVFSNNGIKVGTDSVDNAIDSDMLKVYAKHDHVVHPEANPKINADDNSNSSRRYSTYLVETFYISSKKNTVFQVRLTDHGLILLKEANGQTKEQIIPLRDIIGCRCLRSKRKKGNGRRSATCTGCSPGPAQLKVVEANSGEQDESDVSAYLYIYAYVMKRDNGVATVTTTAAAAAIGNGEGTEKRRDRTTITLRFRSFDRYEDNNQEAQKWRLAIKCLINGQVPKLSASAAAFYVPADTRKLLVMLNPKSGSGKARELFQQRVVPLLIEAELPYDLYVTKYANFARDFVRTRDIYSWRSIIVVGGDGIYYEVLNGLCERLDWERALDEMPVGIVPCGSGNGLAKTISHRSRVRHSLVEATLAIVRGRSTPMDVVRVETKNQIMFSFLSVGWGLIADIDIESERLRAIGGQRFTIWSVHRLISLRTYKGKLSYRPVKVDKQSQMPGANKAGVGTRSSATRAVAIKLRHSKSCNAALALTAAAAKGTASCGDCKDATAFEGDEDVYYDDADQYDDGTVSCQACDMEFGEVLSLETSNGPEFRPRLDSWYSVGSKRSAYFSTNESVYQSVHDGDSVMMRGQYDPSGAGGSHSNPMYGPSSTIPSITAPVPHDWTVIEGDFILVHAAYQSHLGADCYFATSSQLNDGIIWLCIIKGGISRGQLLSFLLGLSSGTHIPADAGHEYIQMVPCTAFRIEPQASATGHLTVDGESVEYGAVQGEVFDGLANVIVPDTEQGQY